MGLLDELQWRGLVYDVTPGLEAALAESPLTAYIGFDPSNDSFAGTNTTAIVLEVDAAMLSGGNDNIQMWATSHRKQ